MDGETESPNTPPRTPPGVDSEDENSSQQSMTFNFDGPMSAEEVRDQALQESTTSNGRSQSVDSSEDGALTQPISFNFGPQPVHTHEAEFIATFKSGSRRSQMPAGARELAAAINNRRRAATNRVFRGVATAYIDEDESGTYDPKRARRTPSSPSRPVKRVKIKNALDSNGAPKPKKPTKQPGFRYEMIVKFQFHSKKALNYLRTLPPGPYESHSRNTEDEDNSYDSGYGRSSKRKREVKRPRRTRRLRTAVTRSDGLTIDDLTEGHPQRRGCKCCFVQGNDDCTLIDYPDEYPCEACDDAETDCILIIPPEFKRACLHCKGKRRNCSYSLDGGKGVDACDTCEEEGVTCCAEPLTESSTVRRFAKLPARIKVKPTSAAKEAVRERMYVSCNQCRGTGKRCTNRGKADPGPCSNCRKTGQSCKFVYPPTRIPQLPTSSSKAKQPLTSSTNYAKSDSSTPPRDRIGTPHSPNTLTETLYSELERKNTRKAQKLIAKGQLLSPSHLINQSLYGPFDSNNSARSSKKFLQTSPKLIGRTLGIAHTHITTSFCHPITFNYEPDPLLKNPCSWCDNPLFGLWGLASTSGPRKVEGFYYPNGGGFEEVFNGFSELGYSKSVMCIECTYTRIRITQCPTHRLRTLDVKSGEFDLDVLDEEKWFAAVDAYGKGDMKGAKLVRTAKWCSICPASAALKCCSPQPFDENGEPVSPQQQRDGIGCEGCGLLLCEDCADLMGKLIRSGAKTGGRQLDTMVLEIKRNRWRYMEGVRADAEFLTSGGELLRRIEEGMGASEGELGDVGEFKSSKIKFERGFTAGSAGARKRDQNGWMNGTGKGKEKSCDLMSGDFGRELGELTSTFSSDGRESIDGSTVSYDSSAKPASSSTVSTFGTFNTASVIADRKSSTATHLSQNATGSYQNHSARPHDQSIPPPSSQASHCTSSKHPRPQFSHSYQTFSRDMNGSGSGPSGTRHTYDYGAGKKEIKRERDTRGEIMFGGLLKERREDVEKAFRSQMGVIDLTDDD